MPNSTLIFGTLNVLCEAAGVIVGCVQGVAGCVVSTLAVAALVAGNMVGNEDSVADFDAFDFAADFAYDACGFMPKHTRCLGNTVPFDDVAAADAARHHLKQHFVFADVWDWDFFDADVMVVVVEGGKQHCSPKRKMVVKLCPLLFGCRGRRLLGTCSLRGLWLGWL